MLYFIKTKVIINQQNTQINTKTVNDMNEYTLITAQGTRNGFLIKAYDMSAAISCARDYIKQGWKIYGIVSNGEIYNSDMMQKRLYA